MFSPSYSVALLLGKCLESAIPHIFCSVFSCRLTDEARLRRPQNPTYGEACDPPLPRFPYPLLQGPRPPLTDSLAPSPTLQEATRESSTAPALPKSAAENFPGPAHRWLEGQTRRKGPASPSLGLSRAKVGSQGHVKRPSRQD